jgi:hypothetical protein
MARVPAMVAAATRAVRVFFIAVSLDGRSAGAERGTIATGKMAQI